jgi:coenzyme F420 hydrogenase subunit beta
MKTDYKKYCTGCGLCQSKEYTLFSENEKGFLFPDVVNEDMVSFCNQYCPMGENGIKEHSGDSIWGDYTGFWTAYSSDCNIRKHSSSGGIVTTICCWLLAHKIVDGVIQIRGKADNPTDTETVISRSLDEVKTCSGSRYTRSSPLLNIDSYIDESSKYAFVGKPCDCIALRNYMEINPKIKESILYLLSFFCAGTPSQEANAKLLDRLEIPLNECASLVYRGDGWPGYTKAISSDGRESLIDYQSAWMDILGRDIRYCCKFCFDSIGEMADISAGDYWFLNSQLEPDFTERDGRNCVFAWTERGKELFSKLIDDGSVSVEDETIDNLNRAQPNHYNRRSTLYTKLSIMKICGKPVPAYPNKELRKFLHFNTFLNHMRAAKGTIERIANGKI